MILLLVKLLLKNKNTKISKKKKKIKLRREKISIIFQDNNLLSDFTVLENVIMPLIIKGEKTNTSIEKATSLLKE